MFPHLVVVSRCAPHFGAQINFWQGRRAPSRSGSCSKAGRRPLFRGGTQKNLTNNSNYDSLITMRVNGNTSGSRHRQKSLLPACSAFSNLRTMSLPSNPVKPRLPALARSPEVGQTRTSKPVHAPQRCQASGKSFGAASRRSLGEGGSHPSLLKAVKGC